MHRTITTHAHPKQTDRLTHRQMDRRANIMAIAQWFILTNASRAKNESHEAQTLVSVGFKPSITSQLDIIPTVAESAEPLGQAEL